jgi:hypothetical protein
VIASAEILPLTVAGQWRIFTAFPNILRRSALKISGEYSMLVKALRRSADGSKMRKLAISFLLLAGSAFAASDQAAIESTFVKPWVHIASPSSPP